MNYPMQLELSGAAIDYMMPMHVLVGPDGKILRIGATLGKVLADQTLVGEDFHSAFTLRRPRNVANILDIAKSGGTKVHLRLKDPDKTQVIGTAVQLGAGDGVLFNLSFGISVVDAVARFNLAGSDFAATDLTVEMLYLVEAKSAAMEESRKLNERLRGAKTAAEAEAMSDTLTGLNNRRALDLTLHNLIARAMPFTLMHLDLDFFKAVNDTYGHAAGDLVLKKVAAILLEETRGEDTVARVGGDEFVLIFNGVTDHKRLRAVASRMISRLEEPISYRDQSAEISASIGMVCSTAYAAPNAEQMMDDADIALYASKNRGRACHTMFSTKLRSGMTDQEALNASERAGQ